MYFCRMSFLSVASFFIIFFLFNLKFANNHRRVGDMHRHGSGGRPAQYRRILSAQGRHWSGGFHRLTQWATCSHDSTALGWSGSIRYSKDEWSFSSFAYVKSEPVLLSFTVYCERNGGGLGLSQTVEGYDAAHEWLPVQDMGQILYWGYNLRRDKIIKVDVFGTTKGGIQYNVKKSWDPKGQPTDKVDYILPTCNLGQRVIGVYAEFNEDNNGPEFVKKLEPICKV